MASGLVRGLSLRDAVALATECAGISVTHKGAQSSYPFLSQLSAPLVESLSLSMGKAVSKDEVKAKIKANLLVV